MINVKLCKINVFTEFYRIVIDTAQVVMGLLSKATNEYINLDKFRFTRNINLNPKNILLLTVPRRRFCSVYIRSLWSLVIAT